MEHDEAIRGGLVTRYNIAQDEIKARESCLATDKMYK